MNMRSPCCQVLALRCSQLRCNTSCVADYGSLGMITPMVQPTEATDESTSNYAG